MGRRKSDQKNRGFTLIELMTVVVIIGVLAAVAIPLGVKYMQKSKTAEAAVNLRKIYDGECAYYIEEQTDVSGALITKQFISLPDTPDSGGLNASKRLGDFQGNGWNAVRFQADGPVLYSYETSAAGLGQNASFTARALGDIDADGTTSLFERVGSVDSATGEVVGGAAIYMLDELE